MRQKFLAILCSIAMTFAGIGFSTSALAQSTEEMKKQIDELQRQIQMLRDRLDQMDRQKAAAPAAAPAPAPAISSQAVAGHEFLERKPGEGVKFYTRGGEVQVYGNLDVSLDSSTKGIGGFTNDNGDQPVGKMGWMASISSNLSYIGVRGQQKLPDTSTSFVYQFETQLDVSVTPGSALTNSNQSGMVKSGLTSRNTFIGVAGDDWGAFKIGKTDAPYKNSTARMNAFSGMWGDYAVIMGNTGGDNRTEFGTRLSHALWYESPHNMNGFAFAALWSPGQNRASDDSNIPSGEPECAGGNVPGSGGLPVACNDGAFGDAYSLSLSWESGPVYLTGAYEMHKKVNRTSDLPTYNPLDVADEDAWKVGIQWKFPTHTTVSAIWEDMKRHVDSSLSDQNERTRTGYWFAISQVISPQDSVHLGWAHANKTPGDPGQHNPDNSQADANGFFPNVDNHANMYTIAWKHLVDHNFSWYLDYATTVNGRFAHYDLGAGGRSVTTDCHDGSNPDTSGFDPNGGAPHCWTGGKVQGVSVGMKYIF